MAPVYLMLAFIIIAFILWFFLVQSAAEELQHKGCFTLHENLVLGYDRVWGVFSLTEKGSIEFYPKVEKTEGTHSVVFYTFEDLFRWCEARYPLHYAASKQNWGGALEQ